MNNGRTNRSPGKCVNRRTNKVINMNNKGKNSGKTKGGSGMHVINIILLLIVVIFAIFLVVRTIQFFNETCYSKKSWASFVFSLSNDPCVSKYDPASYKERKLEDEKEVFHISDQNFSYEDAKCACESLGGSLATKADIVDAYNKGANWCSYGWTKENLAMYPVQQCFYDKLQKGPKRLRNSCGSGGGIQGGYFANSQLKFGANCIGPKKDGRVAVPKEPTCEQPGYCTTFNDTHDTSNVTIAPFNNEQWSMYNK
jgi:hypothetical protein